MHKGKLYCVIADKGLGLHNSGRTYLCCHSRKYLEDQQGEQIYLDTHTLEDAWASPTRREIQQALEQGIEHPSCQACWDDEHAGKKSRREWFNGMALPVTEREDQPQIFDLKMGNTCNMRCRTCNPEVSSQWYREDWELTAHPREGISYPEYLQRWRRIPASYNEHNTRLWQTMQEWIPNAVYIDYYGAEPMLIKKNFEVLEHAVTQGRAGHMDLHFNTNGTIWNQELEDLLKNFRNVYFDLSIDDIGSRCGYVRYSSDWQLVGTNLTSFLEAKRANSNFHFCVCVTINSLNVFYLDEIFDYFASVDLPVNFNMLHLPWHLNIKTLPDPVKQAVRERLLAYDPVAAGDWHRQYWQDHQPVVVNFMDTTVDGQEAHWRDFKHYLLGLDRTRDQDYRQSLPDFARLIQPWLDRVV
jgi:sulfatase maturation enzyme AslB (radical SAM superfamily)